MYQNGYSNCLLVDVSELRITFSQNRIQCYFTFPNLLFTNKLIINLSLLCSIFSLYFVSFFDLSISFIDILHNTSISFYPSFLLFCPHLIFFISFSLYTAIVRGSFPSNSSALPPFFLSFTPNLSLFHTRQYPISPFPSSLLLSHYILHLRLHAVRAACFSFSFFFNSFIQFLISSNPQVQLHAGAAQYLVSLVLQFLHSSIQ